MSNTSRLDALAQKLFSALPSGFKNLEEEIQQQFKNILQQAFSHMDLVTREEFDVQCKVLERTREKLETLEIMVKDLSKTE